MYFRGGQFHHWRVYAQTEQEQAAAAEEKQRKAAETQKTAYRSKEQRAQEVRRRAEQKRIEQEIDSLQQEQDSLQTSLQDENVAGDYEKMTAVCNRLEEIRQLQDELLEQLILLEE